MRYKFIIASTLLLLSACTDHHYKIKKDDPIFHENDHYQMSRKIKQRQNKDFYTVEPSPDQITMLLNYLDEHNYKISNEASWTLKTNGDLQYYALIKDGENIFKIVFIDEDKNNDNIQYFRINNSVIVNHPF